MINDNGNSTHSFNRFELKYVVSLLEAERFRSALQAYLLPDSNGHSGRYTLSSLYYDSPEMRCYRENGDGLKFRRKLRIRHYETGELFTDESPVFLEIKQRYDRVTQKRRAALPYRDALRLCNDRQIPDHEPGDRAIIEEVYAFLWQYNLRPASIVSYDRQAYIGTQYDTGLRVTFDTSLTFQAHHLRLHEPHAGLPMLPANLTVLEIKVNERIPSWLANQIAAHNLRRVALSKYCRSIAKAGSRPSARRNVRVESSEEVLASCLTTFSALETRMGIGRECKEQKVEVSRGHLEHHRPNQ